MSYSGSYGSNGGALHYRLGADPNTFGADDYSNTYQEAVALRDAQASADAVWLAYYDEKDSRAIMLQFYVEDAEGNKTNAREIQNRLDGQWNDIVNSQITANELAHHNIEELKNVPDLVEGKVLRVGQNGATKWTNEAIFTGSDANAISDVGSSGTAALLFDGTKYTSTSTTSVGDVLTVDLASVDTDIQTNSTAISDLDTTLSGEIDIVEAKFDSEIAAINDELDNIELSNPFVTYKSYSDFKTEAEDRGADLTYIDLGHLGESDAVIRGKNMQTVFTAMADKEVIYWTDSDTYTNIFPSTYIQAIITRVSASRCYALAYSKTGSKQFLISQSTDGHGTWHTSVQNEVGSSQGIEYTSGGSLKFGVKSGNLFQFLFNDTVGASFSQSDWDMKGTRISNLGNGTSSSDALTKSQIYSTIESEFADTVNPENAGIGQLLDEDVVNGYGKDKKITYFGKTGKVDTMDTDYSLLWIMHRNTDSTVGYLMVHKDFILQKVDTPEATLEQMDQIGIAMQGGKGALGKANSVAPTGAIWNYAGLAIADTADPNDPDVTDYIDADGNATNKNGAMKGVYSSGNMRNVEDIVFTRGYVYNTGDTDETTFEADSTSPWFIGLITAGGGTFGVKKLFMLFQTDVDNEVSVQEYYDSFTDILGGNVQSNTDNIDLLDERLSALEDNGSEEGDPDENGVKESVLHTNAFRHGIQYNRLTGRGFFSHGFDVNDRVHSNTAFSVSDSPSASGRMNITYNSGTGRGYINKPLDLEDGMDSLDDINYKGISIGRPSEVTVSMLDDETKSVDTGQSNQKKYIKLYIYIETPSEHSWVTAHIFKVGNAFEAEIATVSGRDFTQIDIQYDSVSSGSLGRHHFDIVGSGSGATMDIHVRSEQSFNK